MDNFTSIRADRMKPSGKERGEGIYVYINDRWCNHIKIHELCTPDIEMLTLSLYPFYLPQEFSTLVFSTVYIPPSANTKTAAEIAAQSANAMLEKYLDAPAPQTSINTVSQDFMPSVHSGPSQSNPTFCYFCPFSCIVPSVTLLCSQSTIDSSL